MSVDPYSLCPCGSGKKLKFCCSDLVADLEKIHRMIEGDQPRAALAHIEQTLAKSPERGSLLDMKAMLELSLEEYDAARTTIAKFTEVDSQNPASFAQLAVLTASQEGGSAAVIPLQRSLELLAEEMPARVLQAIGAVGQALLIEGNLVAARAHLWLYQGIAGKEDTRAMELLVRLNQSASLPLLLRDHLYLRELVPGHPAEAEHDLAQILASRGQWARAAEQLDKLFSQHPDSPGLCYNCGLVHGWLGDVDKFVAGLRAFARLTFDDPTTTDDAIEAEAIAQLLDMEQSGETTKVVRTDFPVSDEEALTDRLLKDKRTVQHQLDAAELSAIEGPPPRSTWLLLDRPLPETGVAIEPEQVPRMLGFLSFFGRQTDRPERLELIAERGDDLTAGHYSEALKVAADLGGEALGPASEGVVTGETASSDPILNTRWHFPADTPPKHRRELLIAERKRVLLESWPQIARPALSNKSPAEAAQEPELRLPLAATLLVLQQATTGVGNEVFQQLRDQLDMPQPVPVNPSEVEIDLLPLARVGRADLTKAGDQELYGLYERAVLAGANEIVHAIAKVVVDRPTSAELFPREDLYYRLISLEQEPDQAMLWVDRARSAADAEGKSNATWDILELELRVINGEMEEANRLIQHLRTEHLNEPGIAEQLYQLLYALGAVPPPGEPGAGQPLHPSQNPASSMPIQSGEGVSAGDPSSKLWTPGDDSSSGSSGEKKIWTPS